jgi:hypothetical protein
MLAHGWRLLGLGLFLSPELGAAWRQSVTPDVAEMVAEVAFLLSYSVFGGSDAGGAVALAWLVAGAGGRWRPEPSWVDRAGRLLGVAWLILTLGTAPAMFLGWR